MAFAVVVLYILKCALSYCFFTASQEYEENYFRPTCDFFFCCGWLFLSLFLSLYQLYDEVATFPWCPCLCPENAEIGPPSLPVTSNRISGRKWMDGCMEQYEGVCSQEYKLLAWKSVWSYKPGRRMERQGGRWKGNEPERKTSWGNIQPTCPSEKKSIQFQSFTFLCLYLLSLAHSQINLFYSFTALLWQYHNVNFHLW